MDAKSPQGRPAEFLHERFGAQLIGDDEVLLQNKERVWVTNEETLKFPLACPHVCIGLPLGKLLDKSPVRLDHDFVTLRGARALENILEVSDEQWNTLMSGQDIDCPEEYLGHILLKYQGMCVGRGRAKDGRLKTTYHAG